MRTLVHIFIFLSFSACTVEYTKPLDDKIFREILKETFSELAPYVPVIKIIDGNQVIYSVQRVNEPLYNSIVELHRYDKLRKSAMRMARRIPEVAKSKKLIFEFGINLKEDLVFKQQIDFKIDELLENKSSDITLDEFKNMIGKSLNHKDVIPLLNMQHGQPDLVNNFSIDYYQHGVSISYFDTTVFNISLFFDDELGFNTYSGIISKNYTETTTKENITSTLGNPVMWDTHPYHFRYPADSLIFFYPGNLLSRIIISENEETNN